MSDDFSYISSVAVIGGGPAGLMAAEVLSQGGIPVDLYDAMPSVGRKFLMAGKGGMNITHSEPLQSFIERYGSRRKQIRHILEAFLRMLCASGYTGWVLIPSLDLQAEYFPKI